jgi:hypothetical protein
MTHPVPDGFSHLIDSCGSRCSCTSRTFFLARSGSDRAALRIRPYRSYVLASCVTDCQRVTDGVIRRMIDKWLNAGVLEDGLLRHATEGSPQGGVVSPCLSNIFLHYVLDEWFENEVKPRLKGKSTLVRFADDVVKKGAQVGVRYGFEVFFDVQIYHPPRCDGVRGSPRRPTGLRRSGQAACTVWAHASSRQDALQKAPAIVMSGLLRGFSTCCLRFMGDVATAHARLASGWLAGLYREGVEPSGPR